MTARRIRLIAWGVLLVLAVLLPFFFNSYRVGQFTQAAALAIAVLGGWIIGVAENLAGTYVDAIGADLKVLVPLGIIFVVLLVRPSGLFGSPEVTRA